jgi:hypothetical protein
MITEKQHAVLFALLARQAVIRFGKVAGEEGIRIAVRRYGEQRGHRMALRALRDEQLLTMSTYLQYGEWRSATGEGKSSREEQYPNIISYVFACPWENAWIEADLLSFGRLYCLEIDLALVRGFNSELMIEVNQTLTNGGEVCEFVYHQGSLSPSSNRAGKHNVMPWEYHCAHLYWTCQEVYVAKWGGDGSIVAEKALSEFGLRYGKRMFEAIKKYCREDFNQLPKDD